MPRLKTPKPPCSVQDCSTESWRLYEYCRKHQARLMRTGTVDGIEAIRAINKADREERAKFCKIEGCDELAVQQLRCEWHYDDLQQSRYDAMLETMDIDYDDYWEWVKKELRLARGEK